MTLQLEHSHTHRATRALDVRPFLPAFLLGGYGIFILSLFARGVMTWYINPGYVWSTTLAGGVRIGLSAVALARRRTSVCETCGTDCTCGCGESSPRWRTYALLELPRVLAERVTRHYLGRLHHNTAAGY